MLSKYMILTREFRQVAEAGQVRKEVAAFVDKAYEDKTSATRLTVELTILGAAPGEIGYMHAVYTQDGHDVQKLKPLVPCSHHIHAKFYEMIEDYQEYAVPYDQIIKVLIEGGYDDYLASEWEGQRITPDAFESDS